MSADRCGIAADGRLLVSDAKADRLNLYDPADDFAYLGSVVLAKGDDRVEDAGSVTIAGPLVVVADDDNAPERPNFKIASWPAILAAAGLAERPDRNSTTSELQSLMRDSYADFCVKTQTTRQKT